MALTLRKVNLSVDDRPLLKDVSFAIEPGNVLSLMGPSGCGKSTLLDYIAGTLSSGVEASGEVILDEQSLMDVLTEKRRVGILFQDALLFPHMTVSENLGFGLIASLTGAQREERIRQALDSINLPDAYHNDPATLSGGERHRIALMRTLLSEPKALLLDEPFSRLDEAMKQGFREFVFSRAIERQIPVLMVTHDIQDAVVASELSGGPIFIVENNTVSQK